MTIQVLVADDHPPTRAGIRVSLEACGRFAVCGEAASGPAAVAATRELAPDVALLDIQMPGNGILAARDIAAVAPNTTVVMLTVSRDDADLFAALRAGARGYLLKDIDPARLGPALAGVLDGEAALPRGLVARLIDEFRDRERPQRGSGSPLSRLTDREWEVLRLMQQGRSTAEMAAELFVSAVTVRTHVSAILRKLQVSSREDAVRLVCE